jgi:hypothetical protein
VALGIVVSIATATVWRWLKAERIKPWRFHSWMHPTDENFAFLAAPILRLYAQASFLIKAGFWVVCVDEKTSIQARERLHQSEPAAAARNPVKTGQPSVEGSVGDIEKHVVKGCPVFTRKFPTPGQPVHVAPRYKRQGAVHLEAALSVFEGLIYGCCRESKKFTDFQAFLLEVPQ